MIDIQKVGVIGAGRMGSALAAHIANAGVPVLLMDQVPEGATNRNVIAEKAIQRLCKAKPAAFMQKASARLVVPCNVEDDLDRLAEVDWILEAVVEDLDVKRSMYQKIEAVRKPGSIVSSNTSTIPLCHLVSGVPETFARDFLITHFFNPPRYMRLLEIVRGEKTRCEIVDAVCGFADVKLGKTVVECNDTPGFIANRIGTFWIQSALLAAIEVGLSVEEADAVVSKAFGTPKTGVFGLLDLIGLDLLPEVAKSLIANLPPDDPCRKIMTQPEELKRMIAEGYIGRKGKGGFYKLRNEAGQRVKEARDLKSGEYRAVCEPNLESLKAADKGLCHLLEHPDRGGRYARKVVSATLQYAASLIPEIAPSIVAVDQAMKLGYGWRRGPFQLLDEIGAGWFASCAGSEGLTVPTLLETAANRSFYRTDNGHLQYLTVQGTFANVESPPGAWHLADVNRSAPPIVSNASASLFDLGDGIACFEFHTKMNTFDRQTLALMRRAIEIVERDFRGLVIGNDDTNFSAGINLGLALFTANVAAWPMIEEILKEGQDTFKSLKYAPFPVVGAASGLALGGGCEILLHCDAVQAHAETYMGLVETSAGIIPGWGGCKELLGRWMGHGDRPGGPMPAIAKAFETIAKSRVSTSAAEAREFLFLRPSDGITMNRDRLLADAKERALDLSKAYRPPEPVEYFLPGPAAKAALMIRVEELEKAGKATAHDCVVLLRLARVLTGGDADITEALSEDDLLSLERDAVLALIRHPATLARIEHVLETGRPLRN